MSTHTGSSFKLSKISPVFLAHPVCVYVPTNPEQRMNYCQIVDMNSHTVCALGGMIARLVVDHIAYLTTILLLGNSLKTAIDYLLQLHVLLNSC